MVTNECNLNCKYCYADSGTYGKQSVSMTKEIVDKTIKVIRNFEINEINEIVLFGGEPTLNLDLIDYICDIVEKEYSYPMIKMVSNLTIMNNQLIEILKRHNINLTVSLDGPKNLNDKQRIFKNSDNSTYDVVSRNLHILNDLGIKVNSIEATYTNGMSKLITRKELAKFIFDNFDNVDTVQVCNEYNKFSDLSETEYIFFRNIDIDESEIEKLAYINLVDKNLNNSTDNICNAGRKMISIFSNGDIYPCHLFSKMHNPIASVLDDSRILREKYIKFINKYNYYLDIIRSNCANCNNDIACNICPGALLNDTNDYDIVKNNLKLYCSNVNRKLKNISL